MVETTHTQRDGSIISEVYSHGQTDVFVYANEGEYLARTFVEDLPPDMRYEPKDTFNILDSLKLITKLRVHVRDRRLELVLKV